MQFSTLLTRYVWNAGMVYQGRYLENVPVSAMNIQVEERSSCHQ